jgi:hypothetical protein
LLRLLRWGIVLKFVLKIYGLLSWRSILMLLLMKYEEGHVVAELV